MVTNMFVHLKNKEDIFPSKKYDIIQLLDLETAPYKYFLHNVMLQCTKLKEMHKMHLHTYKR